MSAESTSEVVGVDDAVLEPSVFGTMPPSDITEEMLEINAFDLLRSLERQASQLQAEAEEVIHASTSTAAAAVVDTKAAAAAAAAVAAVTPAGSSSSGVRSTTSMSVSVPNLCVSTSEPEREPTPAAFLESFASVARR